ncbi:hypothetical protein FGO68_gene8236 [Halteria grandinella]|uniref:Uncharacterized protein n=1 Tax=Halteria grandinella TaxID=5974 RepID=A0A8J8NWG2_HALGN|nr:hypothetical protein FGO68_gene8236 [Halteria grandinella]
MRPELANIEEQLRKLNPDIAELEAQQSKLESENPILEKQIEELNEKIHKFTMEMKEQQEQKTAHEQAIQQIKNDIQSKEKIVKAFNAVNGTLQIGSALGCFARLIGPSGVALSFGIVVFTQMVKYMSDSTQEDLQSLMKKLQEEELQLQTIQANLIKLLNELKKAQGELRQNQTSHEIQQKQLSDAKGKIKAANIDKIQLEMRHEHIERTLQIADLKAEDLELKKLSLKAAQAKLNNELQTMKPLQQSVQGEILSLKETLRVSKRIANELMQNEQKASYTLSQINGGLVNIQYRSERAQKELTLYRGLDQIAKESTNRRQAVQYR